MTQAVGQESRQLALPLASPALRTEAGEARRRVAAPYYSREGNACAQAADLSKLRSPMYCVHFSCDTLGGVVDFNPNRELLPPNGRGSAQALMYLTSPGMKAEMF